MISISVSKFDKVAINLVSQLPSNLRPFFEAISYIGHPITTSLIGGLIVTYGILRHRSPITLSGALVWIALGISTFLKHIVERSRPITDYVAHMRIHSFSFPSGHTAGSTIAFGLLAYYAYYLLPSPFNYVCLVLFIMLIFLVGLSRVYLGAHYPTDVVGGWILGGIFLSIVIFIIKPL
jgi:undecaprenyl-diphosphatase